MFDLNPLNNPGAWWQHVLMLVVAGAIGYIIGYRSRRGLIVELEKELAGLDALLDNCRQTTVVAPVAASFVHLPVAPPKHDDLKLVEGIGPKIETLLNKEGIITFRHLSETTDERLMDILRAAGPSFQMHVPESWAHQADMAADGRWDELKIWQDELNKGRIS